MTNRNIEEAREYIINEIIPMFRDRTFEKYVSTRLAADFAIELAEAWKDLDDIREGYLEYIKHLQEKLRELEANQ